MEPRLWFWADVIMISSYFTSVKFGKNYLMISHTTFVLLRFVLTEEAFRVITFSLGNQCFFSSFKLLNGSVWYHNWQKGFWLTSRKKDNLKAGWCYGVNTERMILVRGWCFLSLKRWGLVTFSLNGESKLCTKRVFFWPRLDVYLRYLTCDEASGHLTSATLVTLCRVLREAPEREGGLLHVETSCSAGLQRSLSACCSTRGTHSHLYWWAPFGELVVLEVFQKLY